MHQMTPVYWLIFGIVLIFIEVLTPGLVSLFFGLAALSLALISWLLPCPQGVQWGLFAGLSVVYILLLRKSLKKVFNGDKEVSEQLNDALTGKVGLVTEPIAPNRPGRVEVNGCTWTAEATVAVAAGQSVRVASKKNLTLYVEAV